MTTKNLAGYSLGGHYQIIEQLGEGGMATVYKAHDTRLQRDVAIKVIRMEKGADEQFLKRFEREARALAKLSHPNIVHVNDYGDQDGMPFVVMDYLSGGTLRQKMGQPMPYAEAAKVLVPIARALGFAHKMHIVHRDVKPANILLSQSGDPMLSDFGIAKILEEESTELTGTGIGIGTPEYMAPEQGKGINVDYRADIYALGVVFYELVTGRKPFRADTPMAVILKHMTDPLPRPRSFIPELPNTVENVIFKALAKRPEDRYQSMEEFARALESLTQGEKTAVMGETLDIGVTRVKKSTAVIGGVSFAVVATIIGLLVICVLLWTFGPWKKANPTEIAGQGTSAPGLVQPTQPSSGKTTPSPEGGTNPGTLVPLEAKSGTTAAGGATAVGTAPSAANTEVQLFRQEVNFSQDQQADFGSISITNDITEFYYALTGDNNKEINVDPILIDPNGVKVGVNYQGASFMRSSADSVNINIVDPKPGQWKLGADVSNVPSGSFMIVVYAVGHR